MGLYEFQILIYGLLRFITLFHSINLQGVTEVPDFILMRDVVIAMYFCLFP